MGMCVLFDTTILLLPPFPSNNKRKTRLPPNINIAAPPPDNSQDAVTDCSLLFLCVLFCFETVWAGTHCVDLVSLELAVVLGLPLQCWGYSMTYLTQLSGHPFWKLNEMLWSLSEYSPFATNLSSTVSVTVRLEKSPLSHVFRNVILLE